MFSLVLPGLVLEKAAFAMVQKHVYSCSTQHIQVQHSKGAEIEEIEQWALTSEAQTTTRCGQ